MIRKIKILLEMVKIQHTVFAMPFLYSGAILAANGIPSAHTFMWITVGIISARAAAFGLNRLVDRELDAKNPRTCHRALPRGLVSPREVIILVVISLAILLLSAFMLNTLCVKLYPLVTATFIVYPYLKRFTWLSHIGLGFALGMAPVGGWVAVTESIELPAVLLGFAVAFWVAGFDIIYALQDINFDRMFNLHSIPRRFGAVTGLKISSLFHVLTLAFLVSLIHISQLGAVFLVGVVVIALLLLYEHRIVNPENLEDVQVAFFNVNATISMCFLTFILLDVLLYL